MCDVWIRSSRTVEQISDFRWSNFLFGCSLTSSHERIRVAVWSWLGERRAAWDWVRFLWSQLRPPSLSYATYFTSETEFDITALAELSVDFARGKEIPHIPRFYVAERGRAWPRAWPSASAASSSIKPTPFYLWVTHRIKCIRTDLADSGRPSYQTPRGLTTG